MQLEEFKDLKLSKRQYDKLARTILNRHHKKEAEERRSLEEKARTYSVQDLQEALAGTDEGISKQEIHEVVNERYGKNSGINKKLSTIGLGVHGACAAINLSGTITGFTSYAISGEKRDLILGILNSILTIYNSLMAYKNYKEIQD